MSRISDLYFGRDDAENDIADGLLREGFLATSAYQAALRGRKRLIIGRKGSGKSAICMVLSHPVTGVGASLITPDALSGEQIRQFQLEGISGQASKELMWRYVLAVEVARRVVRHAEVYHKGASRTQVKRLKKFLMENGELNHGHIRFWQILERLKTSLSLGAFGVKMSLDVSSTPPSGIQIASKLEVIEKGTAEALYNLGCSGRDERILLLVDQLETIWSNDSPSDDMIIGLLLAAKAIPNRFPGVQCVLFIRADIYDFLQFGDRDKFRGDELRIGWDDGSLKALLHSRASASLNRKVSRRELWEQIFPISGSKFVEHTLRRPREVIQLANYCRDVAEARDHDVVEPDDLDTALAQFSSWKLQDLSTEYGVNYPFLGELFVIFQDGSYVVTRRHLDERLGAITSTLESRHPQYAPAHFSTDGILDILYSVGFIGVQRQGQVSYAFSDEKRITPDEDEFHIHPCFRIALGATKLIDSPRFNADNEAQLFVDRIIRGRTRSWGDAISVRADPTIHILEVAERVARRVFDAVDLERLPAPIDFEVRSNLDSLTVAIGELRRAVQVGAHPPIVAVHGHIRNQIRYLEGLDIALQKGDWLCPESRLSNILRAGISDLRRQLIGP